jgi:hypothetical protein
MLRGGPGFTPYAPVAVTLEATARALGDRHVTQRISGSTHGGRLALMRDMRLPACHPKGPLLGFYMQ